MWKQLKRIIKPNGVIALFGNEPFSSYLRISNIKWYKYDWVWAKNSGSGFLNASKMPMKKTENISIFYKKLPTYNPQNLIQHNKIVKTRKAFNKNTALGNIGVKNLGGEYLSKYTNYPINIIACNEEKGYHPTQKPLALMEYFIKTYTNEGDTVLDFTMGSGTTGVACKKLNRNFIGIEKDPDYFKIAEKRINESKQRS